MKKPKVAAILAALTLSAGIAVAGAGSADAALGDKHFILITRHHGKAFNADAQVYDRAGKQVEHFEQPDPGDQRVQWDFTDPDGGHINVRIDDNDTVTTKDLPTDRDHCFLVSDGKPRYTGDSVTGGCNAN